MKDLDKLRRAALETAITNSDELFDKSSKTELAMSAGCVSQGLSDVMAEAIHSVLRQTIEVMQDSEGPEEFEEAWDKALDENENVRLLVKASCFLCRFTDLIAKEVAKKTLEDNPEAISPIAFSRN